MGIRMEDLGEVGYGAAVVAAEWWDNKRITEGRLLKKDILKKAGFYTWALIGLFATLMSAFGWWRKGERWMEHVSHGFMYDAPRQLFNIFQALKTTTAAGGGEAAAVRQAKEILARRQAALNSGHSADTAGLTDEIIARRGM